MRTFTQFLSMAAVAMMVNAPQFAMAERQKQMQRPVPETQAQDVAADLRSFQAKYNELAKWEKYGEFFDHMKKDLHPKYVESFLSKVARTDWRDRQIPGVEVKANLLVLSYGNQRVEVEVVKQGDVLARVNGVEFMNDDLPNPETFWKKVDQALHTAKRTEVTSLYGLFARMMVSEARAGMLMGVLLGALLMFFLKDSLFGGGNKGHHHHGAGSNY